MNLCRLQTLLLAWVVVTWTGLLHYQVLSRTSYNLIPPHLTQPEQQLWIAKIGNSFNKLWLRNHGRQWWYRGQHCGAQTTDFHSLSQLRDVGRSCVEKARSHPGTGAEILRFAMLTESLITWILIGIWHCQSSDTWYFTSNIIISILQPHLLHITQSLMTWQSLHDQYMHCTYCRLW